MAFGSGARINTPIAAYNALNALNAVNKDLQVRQLRLATGKRINSVGDDPSGYTIAKQMESREGMLNAAINNVGDAKTLLSTGESALQTVRDLMTTIREKLVSASNPSSDKNAITSDINQLLSEIGDIQGKTNFNGSTLLSAGFGATYKVGSESGEDLFVTWNASSMTMAQITSASLTTFDANVQTAVSTVESALQAMGSYIQRLDAKENNLNVAVTNIASAKSRIYDADIAKEQLEASKLQILQQTSVTQLAQANASGQVFLSLFR